MNLMFWKRFRKRRPEPAAEPANDPLYLALYVGPDKDSPEELWHEPNGFGYCRRPIRYRLKVDGAKLSLVPIRPAEFPMAWKTWGMCFGVGLFTEQGVCLRQKTLTSPFYIATGDRVTVSYDFDLTFTEDEADVR